MGRWGQILLARWVGRVRCAWPDGQLVQMCGVMPLGCEAHLKIGVVRASGSEAGQARGPDEGGVSHIWLSQCGCEGLKAYLVRLLFSKCWHR